MLCSKQNVYEIILIESQKKEAAELIDCLTHLAETRSHGDYEYHFEHIKGTIDGTYEGETYSFYDESVIQEIEKRCSRAEQYPAKKVGLLLDIMLTQGDLDSNLLHYYPHADLTKQIYFRFRDNIPIYIIATPPVFATQSDMIIGVDLSEQYITTDALLRYKSDTDINKLFAFYETSSR